MGTPAYTTDKGGTEGTPANEVTVTLPGTAGTDPVMILLGTVNTSRTFEQKSGTTGWNEHFDTDGVACYTKDVGASENDPVFKLDGSNTSDIAYHVFRFTSDVDDWATTALATATPATDTGDPPSVTISPSSTGLAIAFLGIQDARRTASGGPTGYGNFTVQDNGGANDMYLAWADKAITSAASSEDPDTFTGLSGPSSIRNATTVFIFEASGGSAFTGTVAETEEDDSPSASGTLGYSGSAAETEDADTSSASGTLGYSGTAAVTEAADTSSASGTSVDHQGTASPTEANDTGSASGQLGYSGSASISAPDDTSTASGQLGYSGTIAVTEAADTASASGASANHVGSVAVTEEADTSSASGKLGYSGTLTETEEQDVSAGSGTLGYTGTVAITEAADTGSASGTVTGNNYTGTVAVTEEDDTASAAGLSGEGGSNSLMLMGIGS